MHFLGLVAESRNDEQLSKQRAKRQLQVYPKVIQNEAEFYVESRMAKVLIRGRVWSENARCKGPKQRSKARQQMDPQNASEIIETSPQCDHRCEGGIKEKASPTVTESREYRVYRIHRIPCLQNYTEHPYVTEPHTPIPRFEKPGGRILHSIVAVHPRGSSHV